MSLTQPKHLLVDAHVHLHDCFQLDTFLNAARANFQRQQQQLQLSEPTVGILMLAEVSGVNAFHRLVNEQTQLNDQLQDWTLAPTAETTSLQATHTDGDTLLIMAGRQVVTAEGIEVLTLLTAQTIADGLSLDATLEKAIAIDSLPVLPWGVGKWIGKRGKLVQAQLETLSDTRPAAIFAGDNGGRPGFWPLPAFCKRSTLLPGSDPLPLDFDIDRPGSFGFSTPAPDGWVNESPATALKQYLRSSTAEILPYGKSQSPFRFLKNQSLLRVG